jgi:DnaJ-class molecular chaperone
MLIECPTCRGDGYTTRPTYCRVTGRERDEHTVCPECHGEGEVPETCRECGEPTGTGNHAECQTTQKENENQ